MAIARLERHPVLEVPLHPEVVDFTFDGKVLTARTAEMISSALFANGIHVFGRHRRDGAPQGIFCANGQCAQCLVVADGRAVKACITPVRPGMQVQSLIGDPELAADDVPVRVIPQIRQVETDVLIVGGGPAGLTAAAELAAHGVRVTLCDDKPSLGGKLSLQTHNFFGSVANCYAGQRGMEIGRLLEEQVRAQPGVDVWTDSPVVGVFQGGEVGVVRQGRFTVVKPRALLVAAGARERALAFPGADLPGVYGGGAFQTLVNRDLVKPSERLLIVGGGNVGLIVAYQALQAGVDVVAVVEILPQVGGYRVHRDKILRLGVPVYTSTTVLCAQGTDHVKRVIAARVDDQLRPIDGTEVAFDVDTVLVAVGLSPVNELFEEGLRLGLRVYSAGDAHEIAEASAAMFSGKIVARTILHDLGLPVEVPEEWRTMGTLLASHPGPVVGSYPPPTDVAVYPVIRCAQEIPCNPCTTVCPKDSILIPEGNLLGRPRLVGDCVGCLKCLAVCPGLAISLVDRRVRRHRRSGEGDRAVGDAGGARGTRPDRPDHRGGRRAGGEREGDPDPLGSGPPSPPHAGSRGGRVGSRPRRGGPDTSARATGPRRGDPPTNDAETVMCRCERVTKAAVIEYLRATGTRDLNAVKAGLRSGMGPCGGKTCDELILRVFREMGVGARTVTPPVRRPFTQEVPIEAFLAVDHGASGV